MWSAATGTPRRLPRVPGALYDKFHGFAVDMQRLGSHLATARRTCDEAMKKLSTGTGNLVRQAEMLRAMGEDRQGPAGRAARGHGGRGGRGDDGGDRRGVSRGHGRFRGGQADSRSDRQRLLTAGDA
jgi:hypothetical protein